MDRKIFVASIWICVSVFCVLGVCYGEPTIDKIRISPNKTEIEVGSAPVALTVKASGSHLEYQWKLRGTGILEEPLNEPAIFYVPPEHIDGESEQIMISVIVTDNQREEATDTIILRILSSQLSSPPIKPISTPISIVGTSSEYNPTSDDFKEDFWTPTDCSYIKENGQLIEYYRVDVYEENVWRSWNTVQAASQYTDYEGIIYAFKEGFRDVQRFKIKKGTPLYRARLANDTEIEFGSCWKEIKEFPGHTFISDGVEKRVLKQILYVLDTK
jgi:hypothetical protein